MRIESYIRRVLLVVVLITAGLNGYAQQEEPTLAEIATGDSIGRLLAPLDSMAVADSKALTPDTASFVLKKPRKMREKRDWTTWKPNPQRALWLALVIPGAGQIYNRKYWKLPIVYGGFLGCVYALTWNGQMYSDYSQAYLDIMDSDPNTKSYEKMLPPRYDITGKEERFKGIFKSKKDTFRRFRDLSIFAFGGVYLLSVIDAYVDAELSTFDISHDLSLEIQPTIIETGRIDMQNRSTTPGIQCVLNF